MIAELWAGFSSVVPAVCALASVYIVGAGHGVAMAWTNEVRFQRWASTFVAAYSALDRAVSGPLVDVGDGHRGAPEGVPGSVDNLTVVPDPAPSSPGYEVAS